MTRLGVFLLVLMSVSWAAGTAGLAFGWLTTLRVGAEGLLFGTAMGYVAERKNLV